MTDANGVASLLSVPITDGTGTHAGAIVASYAGDADFSASANASGDLVVSPAGSVLNGVGGASPVGGPATLTATLRATSSGLGLAGRTIRFTLDGVAVGRTAATNSTGVATLTGVPTSDAAGTHVGAVIANYAGEANYVSSQSSGDLVVS